MTNVYGPYSPIKRSGNFIFVSGQIGVNPFDKRVARDITSQTEQILQNIQDLLKTEGVSMDSIVKTTVFLTDMQNFKAMNEQYEKWFNTPRPARSTVGVSDLPSVAGDATILIEIEAIAEITTI